MRSRLGDSFATRATSTGEYPLAVRGPAVRFALFALTFVATACFRADISLKVEPDGSGAIEATEAVDLGQLETVLRLLPSDPLVAPRAPPGVRTERFRDATSRGFRSSADFKDPDEAGRAATKVLSSLTTNLTPLGLPDAGADITLTRVGRGWRFELQRDALTAQDLAALKDFTNSSADVDKAMAAARIHVAVELPGKKLRHNADRVDGARYEWTIDLLATNTVLFAQTDPAPAATSGAVVPWMALVLGFGAVLATALGFALNQRRRHRGTAGPATQRPGSTGLGANGWPVSPPSAPATPTQSNSGPPAAAAGSGWPTGPPTWPPARPTDLPSPEAETKQGP